MLQRVVMPDGAESATVLDDAGEVISPVEAFLAHLQALERSPDDGAGVWVQPQVVVESSSRSWVWSGTPGCRAGLSVRGVAASRAPAENVVVLEGGSARRAPATVNRHLAGLFCFYDYHARNGVTLAQALVVWRRSNRGGFKGLFRRRKQPTASSTRPLRLRQTRRLPRTLSVERDRGAGRGVLSACRDRFLFL